MCLATAIFIFNEFNVLTHFQKICMIIYVYKMGFPCSTISYIRMGIYGTKWVTLLVFLLIAVCRQFGQILMKINLSIQVIRP